MVYGLVEFSKFLIDNGINILAVATLEEAEELRKESISSEILMLSSTSIKDEMNCLIKNDITLTIGSKEDAKILKELSQEFNKTIKVHIKIDTGFGRYGFIYNEFNELKNIIEDLNKDKNILIEGIYSHFSESYTKENKWTKIQFQRFDKVVNELKKCNINFNLIHICNSSAFLNYPNMRLNAARIGSAFLGRININEVGLKKIGVIESNVTEIKTVPKKFNIGYLNSYKTKKETKIAFVQFGYIQGYNLNRQQDTFRFQDKLRSLKNDGISLFKKQTLNVKIDDKKYNIIGKLGMYHMAIDVTNSNVKLNDTVYLNVNPFYVDSKIRRIYK